MTTAREAMTNARHASSTTRRQDRLLGRVDRLGLVVCPEWRLTTEALAVDDVDDDEPGTGAEP